MLISTKGRYALRVMIDLAEHDGGGYTVGSILKLTEGDLAPVACLEGCENVCRRSAECRTLPLWSKLGRLLDDFFEGITLADLIGNGETSFPGGD